LVLEKRRPTPAIAIMCSTRLWSFGHDQLFWRATMFRVRIGAISGGCIFRQHMERKCIMTNRTSLTIEPQRGPNARLHGSRHAADLFEAVVPLRLGRFSQSSSYLRKRITEIRVEPVWHRPSWHICRSSKHLPTDRRHHRREPLFDRALRAKLCLGARQKAKM